MHKQTHLLTTVYNEHPLNRQALKRQAQIQLDLSNAELRHQVKEAAVETLEERVATAKDAQARNTASTEYANIDELEQAVAC